MNDIDCGSIVNAATRLVEMIDGGNATQVWQRASSVGRQVLDAGAFHEAIIDSGRPMIAPVSRQWSEVVRYHVGAGDAQGNPPGLYVAVMFSTTFAGQRTCDERVTLRLDEDDAWRLVGYAMR
ncbi:MULTISPECIES: DUF4019 domain-containing protein [unclassified Lysobacter]|uniref:DUF4019 domain-containing protein n=1 Tax=unclassified Lysobacter TaxID=2635362 RepID=UPI001C224B3E|nr:DUF4019 domain-containing protein [Lysobacter sp. MMG2]MBU8976087.1 DUF4019 domain-containing protein [Lysobacter sp. MMG2]